MPTRAQETNLRRFSAGAISGVCEPAVISERLTDHARRHLRLFHLSPRAAPRTHGIPHHPQLRLRLSRTSLLPANSALHLL